MPMKWMAMMGFGMESGILQETRFQNPDSLLVHLGLKSYWAMTGL